MEDRARSWNVVYWLLAILAVLSLQSLWQTSQRVEAVPYSEMERQLAQGNVAELTIGDRVITGRLKTPQDGRTAIAAVRVEPDTAARLEKYNVPYRRVVDTNLLGNVASWVLPTLALFAIWYFFIRKIAEKQGLGGFMPLGRSRAKVYVEQNIGVRFSDVAGIDEAKEERRELVSFLQDPRGHGRLGARAPKGVLLVGPPGTGKTLLARAVAGEAGVPFFSIGGSEFVEMFVGLGAARVRDLFEQARQKAPAIIFIDELDALGRSRSSVLVGGHDEKEQTLNQLLVEMDGFDPLSGIVILAATNRPEVLDPALLRAGRFDRQVLIERPDREGRLQILAVHARHVRLEPGLDLDQVAALTAGFSGADIENLVNEAALAATRRGAPAVALADFTVALERIVAGLEKKKRILSPREREVVAFHEMGHALVALALPGTDAVHKVSIIPRGVGALGYTLQRPSEGRYLMTREELENRIAVLLAGRAAEHLVFGHFSTGAADDLSRATAMAQDMVGRYGMEPSLGHVALEPERARFLEPAGALPEARPRVSEATMQRIDEAVRSITERGFRRARVVLAANRSVLEASARRLLQTETLTAQELADFAKQLKPVPHDSGSDSSMLRNSLGALSV